MTVKCVEADEPMMQKNSGYDQPLQVRWEKACTREMLAQGGREVTTAGKRSAPISQCRITITMAHHDVLGRGVIERKNQPKPNAWCQLHKKLYD
jgi:hypothetical protein